MTLSIETFYEAFLAEKKVGMQRSNFSALIKKHSLAVIKPKSP